MMGHAGGNTPNEASKFSAVPRGRGQQQAAAFARSMSRRRHATPDERKALANLVGSMFWERKAR